VDREHQTWEDRVLGWEDLDPAQREALDRHLGDCPVCQRLRAQFQKHERAPGPRGEIPLTGLEPMTGKEERAATASFEALAKRLGVGYGTRAAARLRHGSDMEPTPPRAGMLSWRRLAIPLAAAATVLVVAALGPWFAHETIQDLRLAPAGARGIDGATPPAAFHTGDAVVLRFVLARTGRPVVIRVDAGGSPELLHPASESTPIPILPPGPVELPDDMDWTLSGEPGDETFLVALPPGTADVDLPTLMKELETAATRSSSDRGAKLRAIAALLDRRFGDVAEISAAHLP
jgi:hypothetical protein